MRAKPAKKSGCPAPLSGEERLVGGTLAGGAQGGLQIQVADEPVQVIGMDAQQVGGFRVTAFSLLKGLQN